MILFSGSSSQLVLAGLAIAAYCFYGVRADRQDKDWATGLAWVACMLHGLTIAQGWWGAESRFGFAPALSVTTWIAFLVYLLETRSFPQMPLRRMFTGASCVALILATAWPGRPVLGIDSAWLTIHWALGVASYGLFAVAVVHAAYLRRTEGNVRLASEGNAPVPLLTLERLTYRFVATGFILLTASLLVALVAGAPGAKSGMVKWDHKTFFAVLSWWVFAILLAGRWHFGWRGRKASTTLYVGAALLLLSYAGSRFVLEVLLQRA